MSKLVTTRQTMNRFRYMSEGSPSNAFSHVPSLTNLANKWARIVRLLVP